MLIFWRKLLGAETWKQEWQDELSRVLNEAQAGLSINMVVIIAKESDLYAELLFILSFLGLSIGTLIAVLFNNVLTDYRDLVLVPVLGFAFGTTLYAFRRFFISKFAPRAVRDRVAQRAKSQFFDHMQHLRSRLCLVYFSEFEREALFLASPEIIHDIPSDRVQGLLSQLVQKYDERLPMKSIGPCVLGLGKLVGDAIKLQTPYAQAAAQKTRPVFIGASDSPSSLKVPILKGSKDIN